MAANLAKAAAIGALLGGNANENNGVFPDCPSRSNYDHRFHDEQICIQNLKPTRPSLSGGPDRIVNYDRLMASGQGATLVPNLQTVVCPCNVQSLENPTAVKGLDTTWIVENTAKNDVVISWLVDGMEWSPFKPNVKPMDDPQATLKPGDWISVPTFESYVYHVREIDPDGNPGNILLQHRVGIIPVGNPNQYDCDASLPDVEPVNPKTAERVVEYGRTPTPRARPCNTIDVSFRNQVGCPLHVYWANRLDDVPQEGFTCGEKFKFHLGTKPAPQDFMLDWESATKFEGSYMGHTFVARLASDPNIVIDSYTVEPTRIVDCPNLKQSVASSSQEQAQAEVQADGTIQPTGTEGDYSTVPPLTAAAMGGMTSSNSN